MAVERHALNAGGADTVATCGRWRVEPNAVNSVPREVTVDIDLRDTDEARRDSILNSILSTAEAIGAERSVRLLSWRACKHYGLVHIPECLGTRHA